MKVIKSGIFAKPIRLVCEKCHCIFEIEGLKDYTIRRTNDGQILSIYTNCPECGMWIDIKLSYFYGGENE